MTPSPLLAAAVLSFVCAASTHSQVVSSVGGPPPQTPASQTSGLAPATGVVSGVVMDGSTGAPIEGALVSLAGPGRDALARFPRLLSDAKGRFVFTDVSPTATLSIAAVKFGYFDGGFRADAADLPNRFISLADGQWVGNLRVVMWRPATVAGVVLDESGEPVVGVAVRAIAQLRIGGRVQLAGGPIALTDDRGSYRLSGLNQGRYLITVPSVQASFLPAAPATAVSTAAPPGGRPPAERALELDPRARLAIGRFATPPPPDGGRALGYPMAFHGGTTVADAHVVDLAFGEERSGVDVRLVPVTTVTVAGRVDGPAEVVRNLTLRLLPAGLEEMGQGAEAATTIVSPDGTFVFLNVPAGAYTIDAPLAIGELTSSSNAGPMQPQLPSFPGSINSWSSQSVPTGPPGTNFMVRGGTARTHFGRTPLVVGGADLTGVVVAMSKSGSIAGQLVVQADRPDPQAMVPAFVSLSAESASGRPSLGRPGNQLRTAPAGGPFQVAPMPPGSYFLRVNISSGWILKSITAGGRDYSNRPFDLSTGQDLDAVVVTVTNNPPILTGTVRDARGAASDAAAVIVYPAEPEQWNDYGLTPSRIRAILVSEAGVFRFASLPAGDYYVVAVDGSRLRAWQEPEFFKTMAATAVRVTLSWGETKSTDVRVEK